MGEYKEKHNIKNKKQFIIGAILIVIAMICLIFNISKMNSFNKKENTREKTHTSNVSQNSMKEKTTEDSTQKNISNSTSVTTEDSTVDSDYIFNKKFVLNNVPAELNSFIDNSNEDLIKQIQQELYYQGYYSYQSADFNGYCDIDYKKNTVTLNFSVTANKIVKLDAVYDRSNKSWLIKIW